MNNAVYIEFAIKIFVWQLSVSRKIILLELACDVVTTLADILPPHSWW